MYFSRCILHFPLKTNKQANKLNQSQKPKQKQPSKQKVSDWLRSCVWFSSQSSQPVWSASSEAEWKTQVRIGKTLLILQIYTRADLFQNFHTCKSVQGMSMKLQWGGNFKPLLINVSCLRSYKRSKPAEITRINFCINY